MEKKRYNGNAKFYKKLKERQWEGYFPLDLGRFFSRTRVPNVNIEP